MDAKTEIMSWHQGNKKGAFYKVWHLWRILSTQTHKVKKLNKGYLWQSWNEHNEWGEIKQFE